MNELVMDAARRAVRYMEGLASARRALLRKAGWGVEFQGLFGAPPVTVIVGEEAHASILKSLRRRTAAR
jgi:hypothetical protein